MQLTFKYKCGYIHTAYNDRHSKERVQYQVDEFAYAQEAKSVHAAKIQITNHLKSGKAMVKKCE
jgi:hypothetical protein